MKISVRNITVLLTVLVISFLFCFMASAQMKTPSPLDNKQPAEEDDYYEEEQAGGIHYEEEVETLDKEIIQGVIGKRQSGILYCYEKELQTNRKLKGRLVYNFSIGLDGKVSKLSLVKGKSSLKDKKVQKCVQEIMQSLVFPERKKGDPVEINYPFNFQPKSK